MKKLGLAIIPLLIVLQGCKGENYIDETDNFTADDFHEACLDGVVYFMRQTGGKAYMSVKFNKDSTVATCSNEDKDNG